jgi:hypothetical protein
VADAVSRKLAAVQELERKATEIQITAREKEKRIIEAEGIARLDRPAERLAEEAVSASDKMGNRQVIRGHIC